MKPQRPQRKTLCPQREQIIKQRHRGSKIGWLVEDEIIFEVKALEELPRIYEAQASIYQRRPRDREMNHLEETEGKESNFL